MCVNKPKRVLALPDLEQAKAAVLNSLTSASGQRTYDHVIREFVTWYCSEPRLAFNRTVVLRYRIHLEGTAFGEHYVATNQQMLTLRLAVGRWAAYAPRRSSGTTHRPRQSVVTLATPGTPICYDQTPQC